MLKIIVLVQFVLIALTKGYLLPENCSASEIYDPNSMSCMECPANTYLVPSNDGFTCTCDASAILSGASCRRCNSTEMRSDDGTSCVPRRCIQDVNKRTVCRKCPADYVSLTQNVDGSSLREVQCLKCTKGYRAEGNRCVHCSTCNCNKGQIIARGQCLSKTFMVNRPKTTEKNLHSDYILDVVKFESMCIDGLNTSCRTLSGLCVRSFYSPDAGGPCRLWTRGSRVPRPIGLPKLFIDLMDDDGKNQGKITPNNNSLEIVVAMHTADGRFKLFYSSNDGDCFLPKTIHVAFDYSLDCHINISTLEAQFGQATLAPYIREDDKLEPIPVVLIKPEGTRIEGREWSSSKLRRYFILDSTPSIVAPNATNIVFLRTLTLFLKVQRDKSKLGKLSLDVHLEAQYSTYSRLSTEVVVTFSVENTLPNAGILKGLEIWGGLLGALLALYAVVQCRGAIRRGAVLLCCIPIAAGVTADVLYFRRASRWVGEACHLLARVLHWRGGGVATAWHGRGAGTTRSHECQRHVALYTGRIDKSALLSTLDALVAEAGTLAFTLPMTSHEDHIIRTFVYSAFAFKLVKVLYVNWKQCTCDIFFIDWNEYYPHNKEVDSKSSKRSDYRVTTVCREWISLQTRRRVDVTLLIICVLLTVHLTKSWQSHIPKSAAYTWCYTNVLWWLFAAKLYCLHWILEKVGRASYSLPRVCAGAEVSLLVFQEEYYVHYVHGRNDDGMDSRALSGPLSCSRLVCAPQLRTVYKQLSSAGSGSMEGSEARKTLLTRFLAAFFERALEGMSWVGAERTLIERLLDVELTAREGGSTLLYDMAPPTPPSPTWYGEEWSLLTFEVMLFSCLLITNEDHILAALLTFIVCQAMKHLRNWLGQKNVTNKTDLLF